MNNKELLNALENLNIDENEFDHINVELNDLEKKRIKKKYKKAIKKKSLFLKRAATVSYTHLRAHETYACISYAVFCL